MGDDPRHPVLEVFRRHGTHTLWHYTASANLPGIIEHEAIFSRAELERRGLAYSSEHYYGDAEKERILSRYVSCATMPPWGMMQSEQEELAILGLEVNVVTTPETCFCPGWSPWAVFRADGIVTWTEPQHAEKLYVGPSFQTVNGAEIFVPTQIPLTHVNEIVFFDDDSRDRAREAMIEVVRQRAIRLGRRINLRVQPTRFPRTWQAEGPPWMRGEEADEPEI